MTDDEISAFQEEVIRKATARDRDLKIEALCAEQDAIWQMKMRAKLAAGDYSSIVLLPSADTVDTPEARQAAIEKAAAKARIDIKAEDHVPRDAVGPSDTQSHVDKGEPMTPRALIDKYGDKWNVGRTWGGERKGSIESVFKAAKRNGLKDAAKIRHGMYGEAAFVRWARAKSYLQ